MLKKTSRFVVFIAFIASACAKGATTEAPQIQEIEVHYESELRGSYKDSRQNWGVLYSLSVDNLLPENYVTTDGSQAYADLFGKAKVPLVQVNVSLKYNFLLGALSFDLSGATGQVSSNMSGSDHTLKITKTGVGLSYFMDNILTEPLVVPYVGVGVCTIEFSETGGATEDNGRTGISNTLNAGALLQLDWLDPETAVVARNEYGLENAYLDLFVSKYSASTKAEDPDFQSDLSFGAGVKLEF